jgi:nicotinate dehydrogenase subunit A
MELLINGQKRTVDADPSRTLLSVLRDDLDLTGTKYGCGEAQCGACTVLIDGQPRRSCVTKLETLRGVAIQTIEGLAQGDTLHPVQAAFVEECAMQCGYCVPGMIMSAVGLLQAKAEPNEREIVHAMQGNICRCGTYPRVVRAVQKAASAMKAGAR